MGFSRQSYAIGIDAGTTSIKGVIINSAGEVLASCSKEYSTESQQEGWCEVDPEVYWKNTCLAIRDLVKTSAVPVRQIHGISFSSQGETLIVMDDNGQPLRKAIVWLDNRSEEEAKWIEDKLGSDKILEYTGQPEVVPIWPATKILWLRKNEPEVFSRVHKFLMVEDYLMFRLTENYHTEYSVVSSTLYFNIKEKKWWPEMIALLEIGEHQLPSLHASGVPVDFISPEAAVEAGLSTSTLCVSGAYDHPAGAIGAGSNHTGQITLTIGGSMAMCVPLKEPLIDKNLKIPCQCHALEGLYFLLPYGQTAGLVLRWFRDQFCERELKEAKDRGEDVYDRIIALAENTEPGAGGLTLLPHFMGAGSPEFNPKATGVFAGITLSSTRGDFIRAILESVVFMIHRNILILKEKGIPVNEIHTLGGGSKSKFWLKILSDLTGLPVYTHLDSFHAACGASFLAAKGSGIMAKGIKDEQSFSRPATRIDPDPSLGLQYEKAYLKYIRLYDVMLNYW